MNRQPQQIVLPSVADMGVLIGRNMVHFAKRHKVISGSYIFGILFLILVGSGSKLTYDQSRQYGKIMNTVDLDAEFRASNNFAQATHAYRATKGWFTCDSLCQRNKDRMQRAEYELNQVRQVGNAKVSHAKSIAGIFSEVGVDEVKESFWSYFQGGKDFAKRQSMWDMMFMGIRTMSRDESTMEYVLKVLIQVLINFSMGLLFALVFFIVGLWSIVRSYQPNPISAMLFFMGASCAAFAFVTTYLFAIYGAAAGGVYGLAKVAEANMRIDQGGGRGRGRRQNVHNRPHYD